MLITLCYVYLWVRFQKCYSVLIRNSLSRLNRSRISFSFSLCSSPGPRSTAQETSPPPSEEERLFLQLGDKAVLLTEPQACDDLSKWTVLLGSSLVCGPRIEDISFIIEATGHRVGNHSALTSDKKVLKWSDYCLPLACSPGSPFRAVARASLDNFSRLGVAFIEDRLQLDDGLRPSKIIPVLLKESTLTQLLEKRRPHTPPIDGVLPVSHAPSQPSPHHLSVGLLHPQGHKGSLLLTPESKRRLEERRGSEPLRGSQEPGLAGESEDRSLGNQGHMEGHGHHLHLSSCNECLELENSTILSVKYASAENIPDLPDDDSALPDSGDDSGDPDEAKGHGDRCDSKPPNVLVFTGGCGERFEALSRLLSECINMDSYTVYRLLPQQALGDPWMDNTRLLVLAEDEALTPQLQTRFLTFLSRGGRVLGLSSTLCPAGLSLEDRTRAQGQVSRMSFTREDSTELELSVLASSKAFIRDSQGGGRVELWGELKGEELHHRDMVIVRVTHGRDGGEAVLCQVHLELSPDSQQLSSGGFRDLKVNNALRYEVLTEILTSLGLSCELSQTPEPSPVHLLTTSQAVQSRFLQWLQSCADPGGLVALSKSRFRLASWSELQGAELPQDVLLLVTDAPQAQNWTHFSMDTYRQHLKTSTLGHTLLYADVVTSTMDLLEGLSASAPADAGLIAVAARQSHGRGRGGNAWLSPLGCAMFTVKVQVELGSRLGQRIPFLQHLASLALVEAVRTLPGYQDIDLRVKWPNDVYYSDLMKLGGVLVTSSMIGSTFHLLVGCGFNVTNSNPTVCVNDLIRRYNSEHGSSLEPLSVAQLIARSVSSLERLIGSFQAGGPDAVLPTYYSRWIHSGTKVRLWSEDGLEVDVVGLDQNGFLQVHSREQGLVSVEPDGNSFDMLKNLVVMKQR